MIYYNMLAAALMSLSVVNAGLVLEHDAVRPKEWSVQSTVQSDSDSIELTFAVKQSNTDVLSEKLKRASDPKSSGYGKHMTLKEINELTKPSEEAISAVLSHLKEFNVDSYELSSGFVRATVKTTVAEALLSTKYNTYRHSVTGDETVRCDSYSLPENVAPHVDFVAPTVNFPRPMKVAPEPNLRVGQTTQNTPDSLRELYGVGNTMGGQSSQRQACTAFLGQYYSEDDLQSFYNNYFPELYGTSISGM